MKDTGRLPAHMMVSPLPRCAADGLNDMLRTSWVEGPSFYAGYKVTVHLRLGDRKTWTDLGYVTLEKQLVKKLAESRI